MSLPGPERLALKVPVLLRLANQHAREYSTRIEELDADLIVIRSPAGASAALLASGSREVELSWLTPRGRYEQPCALLDTASGAKLWRLRPMRRPILIQRRRYIRVSATVPVRVFVDGDDLPGTTIDVSEGGFRVRLPRHAIADLAHTTVQATICGAELAIPGYVLRSADAAADQTEAVIAFEADGGQAQTIRRFVLNTQLRARVAQAATASPLAD
jgi:c-di-GMP-binding flagellar brake protein YcgR